MQEKKFTRSKIVVEALRNHYGMKVGEFAKKLGVSASTVSTWSNRDSLDEDLVFRKCEGVRFGFLQTGEGDIFLPPEGGLSPEERRILQIVRECPEAGAVVQMMEDMDSDTQKDIQRYAEKEKRTQDRLKELQGKIAS